MFTFGLIVGMLLVSGISMTCLGLYARRYIGRIPAATPYVLLMFCAAAWAILYALDLLSASLPQKVAYHNLRFIFLAFCPVIEIWLVVAYVRKTEWLRRDWAAVLLVIPVISAVLAITSSYHSLFECNFSLGTALGAVPVLGYSLGPFCLLFAVYSFVLLGGAILFLIAETRRKGTLWKMPTLLLLAALAFPILLMYLAEFYSFPFPGLNLTPALLWIAALLYAIALFRYRLLDIVPVAQSRLIGALDGAVLVLDPELKVMEMNPAACTLFSVTKDSALYKPLGDVVPGWPEFLALCRVRSAQKTELSCTKHDGVHYYTAAAEPLLTRDGLPEGMLLFLQDITGLKKAGEVLERQSQDLALKVKELNCLYGIARLVETSPTPDEYLQNLALLLPSAWPQPELTGVRIVVGTQVFLSGSFRESGYRQEAPIVAPDVNPGTIEIFFSSEGDGKETALLSSIAERVGRVLERARAKETLKEKTDELDRYFLLSLDLLCIADANGYFRRLNPQWEKTLGYPLAELEGKHFLDFVHPDDLQATLNAIADLSSNKEVLDLTNRYRHQNGTYRWIEWRSIPKGNRIFAAARDITDRRRMEEALRESEEKYRTIIEEMQDIFYRTDLSGKITMLSPSAAGLAGYGSNNELLGRDVTVVYADPAGRDHLIEAIRRDGSVYAYPLDLRVKDGSIRHVTTSSHFYRDAHGQIQGVEGVIHDVTGLRRAEEALRESEERYRAIIENLQDVFFRVDREDRIVMMSPSAVPMFGYASAAAMQGMQIFSVWKRPELRTEFISILQNQGGAIQDWEAEFVKADGTAFWVSLSAHLRRDARGNYLGTEGIVRDISERKKMEVALKTSLAKLNMLSSITRHDILNQVTALRTFLELSREDLKGTRFAEFVEKEYLAAEAIQHQIEFTRYYQDIGVNAPKWQNLAAGIKNAVARLDLKNAGLHIGVADVEVFADPLIEKVFYNLVENSLRHGEHMTKGEFLTLETGDKLEIVYQDNGTGISEEDKKKLFQRGFGRHTGLGLFLSREILAITGIAITENGEPGKGVRFVMTVPPGAYRYVSPKPPAPESF